MLNGAQSPDPSIVAAPRVVRGGAACRSSVASRIQAVKSRAAQAPVVLRSVGHPILLFGHPVTAVSEELVWSLQHLQRDKPLHYQPSGDPFNNVIHRCETKHAPKRAVRLANLRALRLTRLPKPTKTKI